MPADADWITPKTQIVFTYIMCLFTYNMAVLKVLVDIYSKRTDVTLAHTCYS